ncbi:hypothetical protein FQN57_004659 [Myotisia sp. PD_48]|nr:hypothetical protein FQN57_004659 [Myotisia sp. PD_48]
MATSTTALLPPSGSLELVIELLWQHTVSHLQKTKNEIILPVDIGSLLGNSSLEVFKDRLSKFLNTSVVAFEDNVNQVYRIMPTPALNGSLKATAIAGASIKRSKGYNVTQNNEHTKKPNQERAQKIPRPPNAFILYRQHHHPLIKATHPTYHNNDISVLLGKKWKAESQETKKHFKDLADEIKKKHAEDNPDYQYAPRKPYEKKRRCTSRRDASGQKIPIPNGLIASNALQGNTSPMNQSDVLENASSPVSEGSIVLNNGEGRIMPPIMVNNEFEAMLAHHTGQYIAGNPDPRMFAFHRRYSSPTSGMPTSVTQPASHQSIPPAPSHSNWDDINFDFENIS